MKEKDDDYESAKALMGPLKVKFIPLIVQLIVCEINGIVAMINPLLPGMPTQHD